MTKTVLLIILMVGVFVLNLIVVMAIFGPLEQGYAIESFLLRVVCLAPAVLFDAWIFAVPLFNMHSPLRKARLELNAKIKNCAVINTHDEIKCKHCAQCVVDDIWFEGSWPRKSGARPVAQV